MRHSAAEILREYGPFPGLESIHGVSYDGERVWFASGDRVNALDPDSGTITGAIEVPAHAGTAFDGTPADWTWGYDALGQVTRADAPVNASDRAYEYVSIRPANLGSR